MHLSEYNQTFEEAITPKDYLKSVGFTIELSQLLYVKTCNVIHQYSFYAPILVEIKDEDLRKHYNGRYLLQVWTEEGIKVFERVLTYEPKIMMIMSEGFIYMVDPREDEIVRKIHIVLLGKKNAILKIDFFAKDETYKHLGLANNRLYLANTNHFLMVDLTKQISAIKPSEELALDIAKLGIQIFETTIPSNYKMHGFFENRQSIKEDFIASNIELEDNQMTCQRIYFWDDQEDKFEFLPYREFYTRKNISNDPIVKYLFILNYDDIHYGISMRKSGRVDLYYNFQLKDATDVSFVDIEITLKSFYGMKKSADGSVEVLKIDGETVKERVSFQESKSKGPQDPKMWYLNRLKSVRMHLRLFPSMEMSKRSYLVAHGNMVSVYDLIKNKWVQNIPFEGEVTNVVRGEAQSLMRTMHVILANGKIFQLVQEDSQSHSLWKIKDDGSPFQFKGKLEQIVSDFENLTIHMFSTKDENMTRRLYQNDPNNLNQFKEIKIPLTDDYIIRFSFGKFILFSPEKQVFRVVGRKGDDVMETLNISKDHKIDTYFRDEKIKFIKEIIGDYDYKMYAFSNRTLFSLIFNPKTKNLEAKAYRDMARRNLDFVNLELIDDKYLYFLTLQTKDLKSGFYVQNFNTFVDFDCEDNENSIKIERAFKLKNIFGGRSNMLTYYKQEDRIAYQSNFQIVRVFPLPHTNSIKFFGIKERKSYLAFKRIDDKLIGLDNDQGYNLTTWNVITGKIIKQVQINGQELGLDGFEIYQQRGTFGQDNTFIADWYQHCVLLYNKKDEVPNIDRKIFFKDRYKPGINGARCTIDFWEIRFLRFKVIEIVDTENVKLHMQFNHYSYETEQKLHFSEDRYLMLERLKNNVVFLYNRVDLDSSQEVQWNLVRQLNYFPKADADRSCFNYLFTPNLQFYLDYSTSDNHYLIKSSFDQVVQAVIPQGIMNPKDMVPKDTVTRFLWIDNNTFKIINNEGVENVFRVNFTGKEDVLTALQSGYIPFVDIKGINKQLQIHFYKDMKPLYHSYGTIFENLIHSVQRYYSVCNSKNTNDKAQNQLKDALNTIEYKCQESEQLQINKSFTYLDWKLAEDLSKEDPIYKIEDLPDDQLKLLILNIFPNGNNFLHFMVNNHKEVEKIYGRIKQINVDKSQKIHLTIPFIRNFSGDSPLHICLKDQNFQALNSFLNLIKDDAWGNHTSAFGDILPGILKTEVPAIGDYLSSRLKHTNSLKELDRGSLKKLFRAINYQMHSVDQWVNLEELRDKALVGSLVQGPIKVIEKDLVFKMLDIQDIHCLQDHMSCQFFDNLADVQSLELFENNVIKALIDYKWPLVKEFLIKILFVPFLFYLSLFIVYSNVFTGQVVYDNEEQTYQLLVAKLVVMALLYFLSVYFFINESVQLTRQKLLYFTSGWNTLDILLPILIIVLLSYHLCEMYIEGFTKPQFMFTVHSMSSLFIWMKFLYFLRIFKHTSYFIRMLMQVIADMKIFLLMLAIVYLGFGEALLRLSEGSEGDAQYISDYPHAFLTSLRSSMGDSPADNLDGQVQSVTAWIIYVISIFLVNIVMLNLLIAIIGLSFGRINDNAQSANYQERARLISENVYLIPEFRKARYSKKGQYLVIASEFGEGFGREDNEDHEAEVQNPDDERDKRIASVESKIDRVIEMMEKLLPQDQQDQQK